MSLTSHASADTSSVVDYCSGTTRDGKPGREYAIRRMANGKLRLYEDATSYSSRHGGQCIQWGAVVRDYSPDAGAREGKPAEFVSVEAAAAYAARWL